MRRLATMPMAVLMFAPSQCDWVGLRTPVFLRQAPAKTEPPPPIPTPSPTPTPASSPTQKKGEEVVTKRETLNGHKKPPLPERLPDDVVVKVMDAGRTGFTYCFKKAYKADPLAESFKVRLHVELDTGGKVVTINADTENAALASCLVRVVSGLPYPKSGRPVTVDLPLFYRP